MSPLQRSPRPRVGCPVGATRIRSIIERLRRGRPPDSRLFRTRINGRRVGGSEPTSRLATQYPPSWPKQSRRSCLKRLSRGCDYYKPDTRWRRRRPPRTYDCFAMRPGDPGYPSPSSATASVIMRANRPSDTGPEVRLRSALHRSGLRFWRNRTLVAGGVRTRPDILFPRARVAVFVDGCFWHGCPEHGSIPKANSHYWKPKLARNVSRDRITDAALLSSGWAVVRVWEHESTAEAALRVAHLVQKIRRSRSALG